MQSSNTSTIVLFHSALGLRPGVRGFAERLRAAGFTVHTPDLYEGQVFTSFDDGVRVRDAIGIPAMLERAAAAVAALPAEVVYAGFSMGAGAAAFLAHTRPGARAAILMHGAPPLSKFGMAPWNGVPVQVHYAEHDPWVDAAAVKELAAAVPASGARYEAFTYPGDGHLFADPDLPEYDARSADAMLERIQAFVRNAPPRD